MLERGMATLILWVSNMLYNQEEFDSNEKRFIKDPYPLAPCIYRSSVFNPYLLYSFVHWVIKQKRSRLYFIHKCCRLSLLYNIMSKPLHYRHNPQFCFSPFPTEYTAQCDNFTQETKWLVALRQRKLLCLSSH